MAVIKKTITRLIIPVFILLQNFSPAQTSDKTLPISEKDKMRMLKHIKVIEGYLMDTWIYKKRTCDQNDSLSRLELIIKKNGKLYTRQNSDQRKKKVARWRWKLKEGIYDPPHFSPWHYVFVVKSKKDFLGRKGSVEYDIPFIIKNSMLELRDEHRCEWLFLKKRIYTDN